MEFKDAIEVIKKYNNAEISEALRWITPVEYHSKKYKECFEKLAKSYKELMQEINRDKPIELNRKYWATEWSWSPMCDGRVVCAETIREHAVIDGIDCYFTNNNNRVYFKEHLFEDKEDAENACNWQNSFGYDYDNTISRQRDIMKLIGFENCHWKLK